LKISALVKNLPDSHSVIVSTNDVETALPIPAKSQGRGSSINGGELLMAALATCVCNDVFREAAKQGLVIRDVHVEVAAAFPAVGAPGSDFRYRVWIGGEADDDTLRGLVRHTDTVAEIQNTVRASIPIVLDSVEVL
jgi:uncharacterized OsmC-like protein